MSLKGRDIVEMKVRVKKWRGKENEFSGAKRSNDVAKSFYQRCIPTKKKKNYVFFSLVYSLIKCHDRQNYKGLNLNNIVTHKNL